MNQCLSAESVNESFIVNAPLISDTIRNMSLQSPNWFRDVYTATPWPTGEGTLMQEFTVRSELPQIEEGFDEWALVDDPSGCGDVCAPNGAYNLSVLGGHAFQSKITRLMTRDFKSPEYNVKQIQNTRQYEQIFGFIVQNLYNQINFQKEFNVGQNYMTMLAKKILIDSEGFKSNTEDPYVYRAKGTATLSALTIGALEFLYEFLRRAPDISPFMYSNGMPTFALVASPQLLARMYRDDPTLRTDIRESSMADDLVKKYNFTSTIRDMYIPVPYLYPRRFRWDGAKWVRVLPFVKGLPGIVGTFSNVNPAYEDPSYATHEEVLVHGKDPFGLYYQPTVQTLGEGSDFGPEPGFWDVFNWVNPQTREDPARRQGFYFTTATIGLKANNSESIFGILVPRPTVSTMIGFYPASPTPPTVGSETNVVPDVGCPTPMIKSVTPHPVTSGSYFVVLEAPTDAVADDVIQLGMTTGGYVSATVVEVSSDGKSLEVTISGTLPDCDRFVSMYSGEGLGCSAKVKSYSSPVSGDATRIRLVLDKPIKADTASDAVTLFYGDGTTASATVVSLDMINNVWVVDLGSSSFADTVGGILKVCVPTATDSSCPSCTADIISVAQCTEE